MEANGHQDNSFTYTPQDVEDDHIGQAILDVGGTYPERKLKPRQVPLFPEGTKQGHDPITLDVHKTYPAPLNARESDKFVSSEQYPTQEEPVTNGEAIDKTTWV